CLAVAAATPAVAAGQAGPPRPPGLAWSPSPAGIRGPAHAPARPAFPAGLWRPADGPGTWGPLKAPAGAAASSQAGAAAPGGPWRLQRSPNPVAHNAMLVADSCTGPGACVAVGGYENRAGTQVALAEARSGTGWRIQRAPVPAGAVLSNLFGVSCTAADACIAVGYYTGSALHIRPLAERWNGTSWAIQPVSGSAGSLASELLAVSCPTATACTAGGSEINSAQTPVPL